MISARRAAPHDRHQRALDALIHRALQHRPTQPGIQRLAHCAGGPKVELRDAQICRFADDAWTSAEAIPQRRNSGATNTSAIQGVRSRRVSMSNSASVAEVANHRRRLKPWGRRNDSRARATAADAARLNRLLRNVAIARSATAPASAHAREGLQGNESRWS